MTPRTRIRHAVRLTLALGCASATAAADTLQVPGQYPYIQAAIDAAADGDTILLAAGTYKTKGLNLALDFQGKQLTLQGAGPDESILDALESWPSPIATLGAAEAGGVTLRGLTLKHARQDWGGALLVENGAQLLVEDCHFQGNTGKKGGGAVAVRQGSLATFRRSVFNLNSARNGGALLVQASSVTLEHCTFTGNEAKGDFPPGQGGALSVEQAGSAIVSDSILHGDEAPLGPELHVAGAGSSVSLTWSDLAGGPGAAALVDGGTLDWGTGNIDADPLFKQPQAGNFHPAGGSPCIDTGDPAGPPDEDGTPPDMGALPFAPWTSYGEPTLGGPGLLSLHGEGALLPGGPAAVVLQSSQPGLWFVLLVGDDPSPWSAKGNVNALMTPSLFVPGLTGSDGSATFGTSWPTGLAPGFIVYMQAWAPAAGGSVWWASSGSNALAAETR